eukprot:5207695-Amphidinium_carterae.1
MQHSLSGNFVHLETLHILAPWPGEGVHAGGVPAPAGRKGVIYFTWSSSTRGEKKDRFTLCGVRAPRGGFRD